MKNTTCCFTGHRILSASKIELVTKRLDAVIENLYLLGVTDFVSGGALGFDQIAVAVLVRYAQKKGLPVINVAK